MKRGETEFDFVQYTHTVMPVISRIKIVTGFLSFYQGMVTLPLWGDAYSLEAVTKTDLLWSDMWLSYRQSTWFLWAILAKQAWENQGDIFVCLYIIIYSQLPGTQTHTQTNIYANIYTHTHINT